MRTSVEEYFYDLPEERIAQHPAEPRDACKLLVMDRKSGAVRDVGRFTQILHELRAGDVLVFNSSKVFKARAIVEGTEVLILKVRDRKIDALVRGSRKFSVGSKIGDFVVESKTDDGIVKLSTKKTAEEMFAWCEEHGEMPTPPYVTEALKDEEQYQTVYAKEVGSVAAPTAGLHFTPELLDRVRAKGVQVEEVTLHVGIGTFRPVQVEHIEDHVMHAEYVEIDQATADRICAAKQEGRRIIAVGTTTVRVLEGVVAQAGELRAFTGEVNIFITPGFSFQIIDGLVTNFHLPKSTLLMMISAFAGRNSVLRAYHHAVTHGYRFFSFGDAMFLR